MAYHEGKKYFRYDYRAKTGRCSKINTHRTDSGGLEVVAKISNIARPTVSNINSKYWQIVDGGEIYSDIGPKKNERVCAKCELSADIEQKMANKRTKGILSIRDLTVELLNTYGIDIYYATMHRYCVTIGMYNVDSYLTPHLLLRQMVRRINFVLALIRRITDTCLLSEPIDVDEKWFYVVPLK